jgi:hypothetical protein
MSVPFFCLVGGGGRDQIVGLQERAPSFASPDSIERRTERR